MQASIAHYLEAFKLALGTGPQNAFTQHLDVAHADFKQLGGEPGKSWEWRGNRFRIVRIRSANVVQGTILSRLIGGATRAGTLASSTKAVSTTALSLTESEVADGYVFTTGGTGAAPPQMRYIKDNSGDAGATTITVAEDDTVHRSYVATASPEAWTTLPDATTTYGLYLPWEYKQSAGASDVIEGVALGTVTNGNWTVVVEEGPVLALIVGSTDATTLGGHVVPSSTAGVAKGVTAAGITAAEAPLVFGQALAVYSGATRLTPIIMRRRF